MLKPTKPAVANKSFTQHRDIERDLNIGMPFKALILKTNKL